MSLLRGQEIIAADLSSFALDLAAWGAAPEQLAFLDPPPRSAMTEATLLLTELGAIDRDSHITEKGKRLRALPLPPRLSRMVLEAGSGRAARTAAQAAMVIAERGLGGNDVDLRHRLDGFTHDRSHRANNARKAARNWALTAGSAEFEESRQERDASSHAHREAGRGARRAPRAGLSRTHCQEPG